MADMDLLKLMLSQCTAILFAHEYAALWTGDRKGQVKRSIFAAKSEYAVYFPSGITNGDVKKVVTCELQSQFDKFRRNFDKTTSEHNKVLRDFCTVSIASGYLSHHILIPSKDGPSCAGGYDLGGPETEVGHLLGHVLPDL
jgi:hypothetical protein